RFDPDSFIVRVNVERIAANRPFDAPYVTSLSADAVPDLVAALPTMKESERQKAARAVLAHWSPPAHADWRSWNWSRCQAWQVVREKVADLQEILAPEKPAAAGSPLAHGGPAGPRLRSRESDPL